jgi:hypothetical protein
MMTSAVIKKRQTTLHDVFRCVGFHGIVEEH